MPARTGSERRFRETASGVVQLTDSVSTALRTELHAVLMPLARRHLIQASEAVARNEPPLGHVAAFVLLAHCALHSFVASTWNDHMAGQSKKSQGLYEWVKELGRGKDGKQVVSSQHLKVIQDFIGNRNRLLQHSPQQFQRDVPTTPMRDTFAEGYGKQAWGALKGAILAISQNYGLGSGWLDQC